MQAIVVRAFGAPEVLRLEDLPDPAPGPGELLVRVRAAGVNPVDTYVRSGAYAVRPALPYVPGADGAGEIVAVGPGVAGFAPGDRVYFSGTVQGHLFGAYASLAVCRPDQVRPLPARLSFAQGAAIGIPYLTAYRALVQKAAARAGETVFVHGASGGVGIATVQLARARGSIVLGTAGSDDGLALVAAQGAAHVFDHRRADYLEAAREATGGAGPAVVVEMLANANLERDLTLVAPRGRVVIVGSRGRIEIDPRLVMRKECMVTGVLLLQASPEEIAEAHAGVAAGLATGALVPVVGRELSLAEAARAHELVMSPGARGKIVLVPPS
ncbi:MAG TPA: NADPH:quinone reductase [Vicinamibacterales bacterium]|nr:NADPH:quinone reductase [Vicinamibacterales bacterium]